MRENAERRFICPLGTILTRERSATDTVAFDDNRTYSREDFENQVRGAAAELRRARGRRWGVFCENAYSFAIGFIALLEAEKSPIVLPDMQPMTLSEEALALDGLVSDCAVETGLPMIIPKRAAPIKEGKVKPISHALWVEMFSSGSTGERKAVIKSIDQLEDELQLLEHSWRDLLDDRIVCSTVSHQHIYGLLFKILWPLAAGRPFLTDTLRFPDALRELRRGGKKFALVTSPTYLSLLTRGGCGELLQDAVIFSSGSSLPVELAQALHDITGTAPVEIYGSTETGAIAWRQVGPDSDTYLYRPFPEVELQATSRQTLLIKSPLVAGAHGENQVELNDTAEFFEGKGFRLVGRTDEVIKVRDRLVSLMEVERTLMEHGWVEEAAVLPLGEHCGVSDALGAVIALNDEGRKRLKREGPDHLASAFRKHLLLFIEPSVVPRAYRYTDAIDVDEQGKRQRSGLKKFFEETKR